MKDTPQLGIDAALATFVAVLRFDQKRQVRAEFPNHEAGFKRLARWMRRHFTGKVIAGVESTNTYAEGLLYWLYTAGHTVYLLNAQQVKHYAVCRGVRNKTDRCDAAVVAAYLVEHKGSPWAPPPPEQKTLRELTRTRAQLVATQTALRNQLKTAGPAGAVHLKAVLRALVKELAHLMQQIKAHLRAHPQLEQKVRRVRTMKGIGLITAATLLAELPPLGPQTDPRAIAGWAGLTPRRHQSGKLELPARLSRQGNHYLRAALYMPALVAKRYNPLLSAFAQRLAEKGKSTGAILGAIAHKMLRILVGMLKSDTDFDPNWSFEKN